MMRLSCEALEPRRLLAFDQSFTDVDGDTYRVEVIGNGTAVVSPSIDANNGFIDAMTVSGTDAASRLRITVTQVGAGDGRVGVSVFTASILRSAAMGGVDARPDADIEFENVGQLVFGDVRDDAVFDVSVNAPALPSLGTRTAVLRDVGDNPTVRFGAALVALTVRDVFDANFAFGSGVGTITANSFAADIDVEGPVNEIKVAATAAISGSINGDLKKISAATFNNAGGSLDIVGVVGTLVSAGINDGQFQAHRYGTVTASELRGVLFASTPDASGVSFKTIKAPGGLNTAVIAIPFGGTGGRINTLTTGTWTSSTLVAGSIKSMKVTGDWLNSSMTLTGAPAGLTLGSMTITGVAIGTMSVRGDMGALKFGVIGSGSIFELNDDGNARHVKSITATGNVNPTVLRLFVGSVGAIAIGNNVGASQINLSATNRQALGSLKVVGTVGTTTITTHASQGIGSIRAAGMSTVTIDTAFIGAIVLGTGVDGGLANSQITLRGADAKGMALRSAKLGFTMQGSTILTELGAGGLGAVIAKTFEGSVLSAPTIGSITASGEPGLFGDVFTGMYVEADSAPAGGFSIGRLDVRGFAYQCDIAAAGSIDRISIVALPANDQEFRVTAGQSKAFSDFPADINGLNAAAAINRITITSPFDAGTPSFSGGVFIAPTIGTVTIKGLTNTSGVNDGGELFGFGARTFGTITLKDNDGTTVKPEFGMGPGTYGFLNPNGNFAFVLYA